MKDPGERHSVGARPFLACEIAYLFGESLLPKREVANSLQHRYLNKQGSPTNKQIIQPSNRNPNSSHFPSTNTSISPLQHNPIHKTLIEENSRLLQDTMDIEAAAGKRQAASSSPERERSATASISIETTENGHKRRNTMDSGKFSPLS